MVAAVNLKKIALTVAPALEHSDPCKLIVTLKKHTHLTPGQNKYKVPYLNVIY